jgi:ribonuclease P protein component
MLNRENRLRSNQEFQRVYRQGRSWSCPALALNVLQLDNAAPNGGEACRQRIGFSVSKKLGGAVERNRVRRRLRHAARELLHGWKAGFEAVVVARGAAASLDFEGLREALGVLAERAGLAREPGEPVDAPYSLPPGRKRAGAQRGPDIRVQGVGSAE